MSNKIILWDVMDTLVHDPFRDAMPGFFGMSLDTLLKEKHPTAWVRFERGELSEQDFLATFFHDGRSYDIDGFKACIRAAYRWLPGIEPLLDSLRCRGVEMHTLSNYPEWYVWIEEQLELSRYVAWTFVSCRTRWRKPEPAAFEHAIHQLGCSPDRLIFVDDRRVNCEAAAALGIHAIEFDGDHERLSEALQASGIPAQTPLGLRTERKEVTVP